MMNNTYKYKVIRNPNNKTALVRLTLQHGQVVAPNLFYLEVEVSMEPGDSDEDLEKKALETLDKMETPDKDSQDEFTKAFEEAIK